jgi:hypothetical protein
MLSILRQDHYRGYNMRQRENVRKHLSFQLTSWGLVQNVQRGDISLYSSTLFSEISGGEVISIRYSWLLLLAVLATILGGLALVIENLFVGVFLMFLAVISLVAYLLTKKTELRFTNTGGVVMSHVIQGNQRQACAEFIHLVEKWKLRTRQEQIATTDSQPDAPQE